MIEEQEVTLETEHLEEVIEAPPTGQPVVVIQYRSRGVPWYLVLPLLVLIPLGSVAVYHRVTSRARRALAAVPVQAQASPGVAATTDAPRLKSAGASDSSPHPFPTTDFGQGNLPLALNSQPIAPAVHAAAPASVAAPKPPGPTGAASAPASPTPPATPPRAAEPAKPQATVPTPPTPLPPPAPPAASTPGTIAGKVDPVKPGAAAAPPARPASRAPLAVGFSVPADEDNPFAELNIVRNPPGTASPEDRDPSEPATVAASVPASREKPPPTREELLDDIRAEAAEKRAKRKQLNNIKDRARGEMEAEALARTEEDRVLFRRELREILKSGSKKAGQEIDDLCDKYGRNYDPELRARVTHVLTRTNGRMSRDAKVRLLRVYGVPEPGILDFLANDLHRMINSRNGPRDSNEVRISAANQLLTIKLGKDPGAAGGLQAQRGRPAGATPPGRTPGNTQAP